MVAVDAQGNKIENRYMNKDLDLTKANWERANRGGPAYSASNVQMCAASNAGFSSTQIYVQLLSTEEGVRSAIYSYIVQPSYVLGWRL